ncbi:polysaccharide deacetylase family protein [Natronorarus salvus]|uniref:polysaccharide deacetylase family protein n=1 Tax=Natronorarus salvus TaxID=3117733 RepID=UPI002F262CF6
MTLDLENDWYFDEPGYDHLTFEYIEEFIGLIDDLGIPISIFVVGRTLERFPEVIDQFDAELDVEFHLHSYGHDTSKSYDFREEVRCGKQAFASHFGSDPIGYRAPQGNIEPGEFTILEQEGFQFDSSVFPSYRPGVYNNLDKPLHPYRPAEVEELLEIPIAATPYTRVPICQSYIKLLGRPYRHYLRRAPLPAPLVFNVHLQDLFRTDSHDRLGHPKRFIMKRNLDHSAELFAETIDLLREREYWFGRVTDVDTRFGESQSRDRLVHGVLA